MHMKRINKDILPQVENKICEIFGVDRSKLFEKTKIHSVVSARRTLLHILLIYTTHTQLAKHYNVTRSMTYHTVDYIPVCMKYNREFREKYQESVKIVRELINQN